MKKAVEFTSIGLVVFLEGVDDLVRGGYNGFTINISTSIQTADITMATKACPACSWMNVFNLESSSSIEVEREITVSVNASTPLKP